MTEPAPKKQLSLADRYREKSGLYKLGFDFESFKGISFPFIAMGLPIVLAILIWQLL